MQILFQTRRKEHDLSRDLWDFLQEFNNYESLNGRKLYHSFQRK